MRSPPDEINKAISEIDEAITDALYTTTPSEPSPKQSIQEEIAQMIFNAHQTKIIQFDIQLLHPPTIQDLTKSEHLLSTFKLYPTEITTAVRTYLYDHRIKGAYINASDDTRTTELILTNKTQKKINDIEIPINQIQASNRNQIIAIRGTIKSKEERASIIERKIFYCPFCYQTHITSATKKDPPKDLRECPSPSCGHIPYLDHIEAYDVFNIDVEENIDETDKPRMTTIPVIISKGLARPEMDYLFQPGNRIWIIGELQTIKNPKSNQEKYIIHALGADLTGDEYSEIKVTTDDIKKFYEIKKEVGMIKYFSTNYFTNIYGNQNIKEATITQMVGNPQRINEHTRSDINIHFGGDPGTAKSQHLMCVKRYAPKVRSIAGGTTTTAGMIASLVKNETTGAWTLYAGAMPLASGGILEIDELDKLKEEDKGALHEAMEQQTISYSKANVQQTFKFSTSILSASNPKFGVFSKSDPPLPQLGIIATLLSRYDLIYILYDDADKERIRNVGNVIKAKWMNNLPKEDIPFIKKYITYAKTIKLKFNDEKIFDTIILWFIKMRESAEEKLKDARFGPRAIESVARLSIAHARAELNTQVEPTDIEWAITAYTSSMKMVATDEFGRLDMNMIDSQVTYNERKIYDVILKILDEIPLGKSMNTDELYVKVKTYEHFHNLPESIFEKDLQRLVNTGNVFHPQPENTQKLR